MGGGGLEESHFDIFFFFSLSWPVSQRFESSSDISEAECLRQKTKQPAAESGAEVGAI